MTRTANEHPNIFGGGNRNKFYTYPTNMDNLNQAGCFNLGGGLIALKGFYTSVRTSTARLLVNINVANAAFYPAIPLLGLMRLHTPNPANDAISGLEVFITRLKVSHTYIKNKGDPKAINKRVKTVQGFSHPNPKYKLDYPPLGNAKTIMFPCPELQAEGKITVEKYFKLSMFISFLRIHILTSATEWNRTLQHAEEPCINLGTKQNPVFVPPELLTVEPGQQYVKKLEAGQTRAMISFAVRKPAENARRIVEQGAAMMGLSDTNQKLVSTSNPCETDSLLTRT